METLSKDDLAALRAIAEDGRYTPLRGGTYLVGYGSTIATFITILWINFRFPEAPLGGILNLFGVCVIAAMVAATFWRRRLKAKPNANTMVSRVEHMVWWISHLSFMICIVAINLPPA
jgi:hypothetical protein